jgi:hypothetical protein
MSLDIQLTIPEMDSLSEPEILSPCFYSLSPIERPTKRVRSNCVVLNEVLSTSNNQESSHSSSITKTPIISLDPWEDIEYLPTDDETRECGQHQSSFSDDHIGQSIASVFNSSTRIIKKENLSEACLTLEAFQDFLSRNQSSSQNQIAELLLKSLTLVMGQIDKFILDK